MFRARLRTLAITSSLALALASCSADGTEEPASPEGSPTTESPAATDPSANPAKDELDIALSEPRRDSVYPEIGEPGVDALRYRLDLTWDPETTRLDGIEQLTFRATKDARRVQLDFSAALDVKEVRLDGAAADWTHRRDKLRIHRPVEADQRYVVQLQYGGTPGPTPAPSSRSDFASGIGFHVTENGEAWTLQEPYGAFTWYAVNDHPSDKALYDFTLTVPEPWTGVANGTLTETTEADGLRTTRWYLPQPASSYLTTVAFADYSTTELTSVSGVPITLYWLTRDPGTKGETGYAADAMDWIEDVLGPYPFDTLGAVVVDAESAMETQTMVTLGTTAYTLSRDVLVHELIHQWYGDSVSPDDWSDVWINEGITMYLQWMWEADHGPLGLDEIVETRGRAQAARLRSTFGPPAAYLPQHFGAANIYYIPAVMWHDLRAQIGDETFFEMLRAWPAEKANQTTNRAEYIAWVEESTGEELSDFFDAWLFGEGT